MKTVYSIFATLIVSLFTNELQAQISYTQPDTATEKSEIRIGLKYTSDYLYMGRSDSAKAPYLSPSISYFHKSGFFIHSSFSYLTAKDEGRIDLVTLSGGYDYYKKNFAMGVSLSEYFFSTYSYAVQAEMNTYVNAFVGYDFSLFTLYGDASVGFSDATDFFLGAEIDRTFYAFRNHLLITPSVSINAGSQQYFNEYFIYRSTQTGYGKGSGKGKGSSSQTTTTTTSGQSEVLESNKFKILDYESAIQLTYKINNFRIFASAVWTFPVNPATLVSDEGEYQEDLKNGFYWTTGVRMIIK
jgi:hypothetical protein